MAVFISIYHAFGDSVLIGKQFSCRRMEGRTVGASVHAKLNSNENSQNSRTPASGGCKQPSTGFSEPFQRLDA